MLSSSSDFFLSFLVVSFFFRLASDGVPGLVVSFFVTVNIECGTFSYVLPVVGQCTFTAIFVFGSPISFPGVVVTSLHFRSPIGLASSSSK